MEITGNLKTLPVIPVKHVTGNGFRSLPVNVTGNGNAGITGNAGECFFSEPGFPLVMSIIKSLTKISRYRVRMRIPE